MGAAATVAVVLPRVITARDTGRAMSQENVEVVRRWLAIGSVGPEGVRATVAEFCDADVDYYPVRKFSDARPCHGLEEFSEWLAGRRGGWVWFGGGGREVGGGGGE